LSTAQVKPILETIAAKAPNLASKARQYVGGIVSYAIHNDLREASRGQCRATHA